MKMVSHFVDLFIVLDFVDLFIVLDGWRCPNQVPTLWQDKI